MSDLDPFKIFMEIQLGLPRNGPGSREATRAAFKLLPPLPSEPEILDLGAGQGAATLELLRLTDGRVTAVDIMKPFLDRLEANAEGEGVPETRLRTLCADFEDLHLPQGVFDLIWSEGAIYNLGFEEGLALWRPFLAPGRYAVVSDCIWKTDEPSLEIRHFWDEAYPSMGTLAENAARAQRAGFEVLGTHWLTEDDWWTEYYGPMKDRIRALLPDYAGAPEALAVFKEEEEEMELFERFQDQYGYCFFVLQAKS